MKSSVRDTPQRRGVAFCPMRTLFLLFSLLGAAALAEEVEVIPPAPIPSQVFEPEEVLPAVVEAEAPLPALPAAAPAVPNFDSDLIGAAKMVHALVVGKEWGKLLFVAVAFLVWLSRKVGSKRFPFLGTKAAAISKAFLFSFAGMLATTWPAGQAPNAEDVYTAVQFGFASAGSWSIFKAFLEWAAEVKKWAWAAWVYEKVIGKEEHPHAPLPVAS